MNSRFKFLRNFIYDPVRLIDADDVAKNRALAGAVKIAVFLRIMVSEYGRNHCTSRASGIAFVLLITIIPLIATAAIFYAGIADINPEQLERAIETILPYAPPTVVEYIITFFKNAQTLKGVGVGILIIMAMSLFNIVEQALNAIWKVLRSRSFFSRLRTFTMVLVYSPILFFVSYQLRKSGIFGILPRDVLFMRLLPVIFTTLAFTTFFWFIPNTRVRISSAIIGGVISCALFELERWGFRYYVNVSIQTHTIYGTFGLVVFFLLSLYFTALLFLIGAQVAYVYQNFRPLLRAARRRDRRVGDYRSYIAVRMILDCASAFIKKQPPPSLEYFCETYELTVQQADGLLNWLVHENFIHEINAGKHRQFVPARDFAYEPVSAILSAIEDQHRRIPLNPNDYTRLYLIGFMDDYGRKKSDGDLTLGELIEQIDKRAF